MPRRKGSSRIYSRTRGGEERYYGDFRDYAPEGGGQEALIPAGGSRATTDRDVAEMLASTRLQDLERRRRNRNLLGRSEGAALASYADYHLVEKARAGNITAGWLATSEKQLTAAADYFGADRELDSITTKDVQSFAAHLAVQSNGRGGTLSGGSIRHYLNCLSNVYRRAQSEGFVAPGFNPVAALVDKPRARRHEARWLEVHEAALLLESARTYKGKREGNVIPIYPIIATMLLTGGRKNEVLGLEVTDVSFDRKVVTFRDHAHRRLKTHSSRRSVPLWPQLEEILRAYVFGGDEPLAGGLLFPPARTTRKPLIWDLRKPFTEIATRADFKAGEVHLHALRHTYCAARLQTLDRGAPVSEFTVGRELGHGGHEMIRHVYGHLGQVRHRAEVVEYRAEQFLVELKDRLVSLKTTASSTLS